MNDYVSKLASPGTLYHTLQRHNDILRDYSQEFSRTKVSARVQQGLTSTALAAHANSKCSKCMLHFGLLYVCVCV